MGNLNKKPGQGKNPQQYRDSSRFAWDGVVGMVVLLILASLLSCSHRTHVITEDGVRWYTTDKK